MTVKCFCVFGDNMSDINDEDYKEVVDKLKAMLEDEDDSEDTEKESEMEDKLNQQDSEDTDWDDEEYDEDDDIEGCIYTVNEISADRLRTTEDIENEQTIHKVNGILTDIYNAIVEGVNPYVEKHTILHTLDEAVTDQELELIVDNLTENGFEVNSITSDYEDEVTLKIEW